MDDAITFLRKHEKGGWVNLNAKYGRSGNPYMELDTYEPKAGESKPIEKEAVAKDLPF